MAAIAPSTPDALSLQIRQIRLEGPNIHSYELADPDGGPLPEFDAGAHLDIHIAPGLTRQYSLCNDPAERHRYVIAVLRDEQGRGGSRAVHDTLRVGQQVTVSRPRNNFRLVPAPTTILIAGGIGVTPMKAMAHELELARADYEFHYCAKNATHVAFKDELMECVDNRMHFHFDNGNPADGLDIAGLLRDRPEGAHVYYCGPAGFMKACEQAAGHWPAGTVHFEHFKAPVAPDSESSAPAGSFTVRMKSRDAVVTVQPHQSIVEALGQVGVEIPTSCQSGLCGSCKVRYVSGEVDHQDCILGADEQAEYLTACVSRGRGCVVLDI